MKVPCAACFLALLAGVVFATPARAQQMPQALNPQPNPMQTTGKVGNFSYGWTNGKGWMSLSDDAKVAMVAGIEQGIILSVRENWDAVGKANQQVLTDTASRLTVNGYTFEQMVIEVDKFYLQPGMAEVPVVDAYTYSLMELKQASKADLDRLADRLRKAYPMPKPVAEPKH